MLSINAFRLERIKKRVELLLNCMDEKGNGEVNIQSVYNDMRFLISENERVRNENKRLADSLEFTVREVEQYEKMNHSKKEGASNATG